MRWVNEGKDFNCEVQYRDNVLLGWRRLVGTRAPSGAGSNPRLGYFGTPGASVRVSCDQNVTSNEITW